MEETVHFPRGSVPSEKASPSTSDPKKRRRRGEVLTTQKKKSDDDDVLFGKANEEDAMKRRKISNVGRRTDSRNKSNPDDLPLAATTVVASRSVVPLGGGGCTVHPNTKAVRIEPLRFPSMVPGLQVLAICRRVYPDLALFSLPYRWTAYMLRHRDTTPPLHECLSVGQHVPVRILKVAQEASATGPRRRVEVSCLPAHINPATLFPLPNAMIPPSKTTQQCIPAFSCRGLVLSMEDHGLLLDLGRGQRGFLPHADDDDVVPKLPHPRLLECVVTGPPVANVYPLSRPVADVCLPLDRHSPPLSDLVPGTLIANVQVEQTVTNGLAVTFGKGGIFRGAIEATHLLDLDLEEQYAKHRLVNARLLAVDPPTQLLRFTLLPHLLRREVTKAFPPVGTIVPDCTVVRVEPGMGVVLSLPPTSTPANETERSEEDTTPAPLVYVPMSKAVDGVVGHKALPGKSNKTHAAMETATFLKQFAVATRHTVRILSTDEHLIENMASGATAPSYVNAHVLTHADLVPGRVYKQVPVLSQLPDRRHGGASSVMVDFGLGVHGLIPALHLFDTAMTTDAALQKMLTTKYAIGAKVDVRVLTVDVEHKKCLVTAKKSLVKAPDDHIITSYDDVTVGQVAVGFISKIDDTGLYVTFCHGVFGRVTARSLAIELGVENHYENYHRGDVVSCRVANVQKRRAAEKKTRRPFAAWRRNEEEEEDGMDTDAVEDSAQRYYHELTLSLRLDGPANAHLADGNVTTQTMSKVHLSAGTILPLKSLRVVKLVPGKDKGKHYVPGYAIVSIKSKYIAPEAEAATLPPFIECKLPFDQLLDHYNRKDIADVQALDALAANMLTVGKKINRRGLVLSDPKKSSYEYSSGTGQLAVVTIREHFVETFEAATRAAKKHQATNAEDEIFIPGPNSHFFVGAHTMGYVASVDERHGAFVRFLDGMTGLVSKGKNGLRLQLYSTVVVKVLSVDDKFSPPKVSLGLSNHQMGSQEGDDKEVIAEPNFSEEFPLKPGDVIEEAVITKIDFHRVYLSILDEACSKAKEKVKAQMHCTMAKPVKAGKSKAPTHGPVEQIITACHPFSKWNIGDQLRTLRVLSVVPQGKTWVVELTNRMEKEVNSSWYIEKSEHLTPGDVVSGIVTGIASRKGLWVDLSPTVSAFIPALELSIDANILNHLEQHFHVGSRLKCVVLDKLVRETNHRKYAKASKIASTEDSKANLPFLSLIGYQEKQSPLLRPQSGDLVVGRIDRSLPSTSAPELMLEFRGGHIGRCCITELAEVDDWKNFPLGRSREKYLNLVPPSQDDSDNVDESHDDAMTETESAPRENSFAHGTFVQCRVLPDYQAKSIIEVSLRPSRLEGDLDDDDVPEIGDVVQAFVVETGKKGCFLRLSRQVEGRTILKELCDGFLPDPVASFPMGRLVVGKVKSVQEAKKVVRGIKTMVDIDMRESVLIDDTDRKIQFNEVEIGGKYSGTVMRIEEYGVFVRLENSDVSGLVHKSECSDNYIKKLTDLYDPGDMVKVVVLKKNVEKRQIGFGMKASYFKDDPDSDDESSSDDDALDAEDDDAMMLDDDEIASDDENYVSKLSAKLAFVDDAGDEVEGEAESEKSDEDVSDDDESDNSSASSDADVKNHVENNVNALDTNVGFDWNGGLAMPEDSKQVSEDDSDSSDEDDDDENAIKLSHKSRRKQAQRRKEEQEISRRETALADGTADENPETAADFERLLAGEPNSSELWIRYMAFHLTMADIPAARAVANRAFDRIEFRLETEKLNVWCALLTLELKYGTDASLQATLDRACQHNNPKYVYLRLCEMMAKHQEGTTSSSEVRSKTDATFVKMCSKFRSKKKVWIAHLTYLLEQGRHDEAQKVMQRALLSLPTHKHVETLSRYATLAFAHGRPATARTVFQGMLQKYPKRLDILFVYADQEMKHGHVSSARSLFQRVAKGDADLKMKLNDKQMKRLFKKWFTFEEAHGTEVTQEGVKDAARAYIAQSK